MTERDLSDDELFAIWDEHYADVNSYERPPFDRALLRTAILADRLRASEAEGNRVYLVATGEFSSGYETYTRHENNPPLCDSEVLYTHPASASEAAGWQPIETAPKDGTEVLLWREDFGQFIGSYTSADSFMLEQKEIDQLSEEELFDKDWFTQWPDARRLEGSELPTLWQPLPASPTLGTEGGTR